MLFSCGALWGPGENDGGEQLVDVCEETGLVIRIRLGRIRGIFTNTFGWVNVRKKRWVLTCGLSGKKASVVAKVKPIIGFMKGRFKEIKKQS